MFVVIGIVFAFGCCCTRRFLFIINVLLQLRAMLECLFLVVALVFVVPAASCDTVRDTTIAGIIILLR